MRVIGGTFGGRRLKAVEGHVTRPTSDRVREALFSRLEARYGLSGAIVLDVFAGTGALAFEALSRGAWSAVCIELDKRAVDTLRDNVRDLELTARVRVIADDYRRVLARFAARRRFDGVFLDPPYGKGLAVDALEAVAGFGLMRPGGWITVEVGKRETLPEAVEGPEGVLRRVREDIYGDTRLGLFEAEAAVKHNEAAGELESPAAEAD
ncbi:MAG: 16S rRNA (guanine(966)-N(2))-methyltransferase RsmD [Candidatus Binatia bacterium]